MIDVAVYVDLVRQAAIGVAGASLVAALVAALLAAGYRRLTTREPPAGTAAGVGVATVAGYLTATALADGTVIAGVPLDHQASAGYLLATIAGAGTVAVAAARLGDRIAGRVCGIARLDATGEAASTVRSARLAVELELPETIADADGYRPVASSTRRAISGVVVRLPHDASPTERRDRIERRLERDYDVGYADVTVADDGSVDRVLVGRRAGGLGSMLPPKTVAVAIRTESRPDASAGDPVEIRSAGSDRDRPQECARDRGRLVATGTVRATTGTVATVLVDAERAGELAPDERYRLVTRPDEPTDGYEFAATVRAADETVATLRVATDGPLAGEFVDWLPGRVLVIERDEEVIALPEGSRTLRSGDELWVLARPTALTAFDAATADRRAAEAPSRSNE